MAKVISTKRLEGESEKARNYIRSYILFPSSILGLLAIVIVVFSLVYQLIQGSYAINTFTFSSGLMLVGIMIGWGQTRYHKFLLRAYPSFFASRMKQRTSRSLHQAKKQVSEAAPDHRGRWLVPWCYLFCISGIISMSGLALRNAALDPLAAFSLPWAGFFWAKMFFWRDIIAPLAKKKFG